MSRVFDPQAETTEVGADGLERHAYIAGEEAVLEWATRICPDIERACLGSQQDPNRQRAIAGKYDCRRIQFGREVTPEAIAVAKQEGRICNLFWSDEPEDACSYVGFGIDVVLTNRCHLVSKQSLAWE